MGINVGIPVPVSFFPFAGHKDSFFGESHMFGREKGPSTGNRQRAHEVRSSGWPRWADCGGFGIMTGNGWLLMRAARWKGDKWTSN